MAHLHQQGRFADPGLAAHQHKRPMHRAAAEHPVELSNARVEALLLPLVNLVKGGWPVALP
jgi:hypothetical protein